MEFSPCLPSPALSLWCCHTFRKIQLSRTDKWRESVLQGGSCRMQPVTTSHVSARSPSLSLSSSHLVCVPPVTLTLTDVPRRPLLFSFRKDSPSLECDSFPFICLQFFFFFFCFVLVFKRVSVQFSSVAQSCPTLCDPMNCSTPGLPVYHQLPEFTQTHIHQVGDAIQLSHPLSSPSPPAPNPSQHQSLFQ